MTQGMATTAALQISQLFIARSWRALFVVMLVSLHLAAMWGTEDYWARGLMLAHFGLFILWQPFMRSEHRLTSAQVAAIAAIALGTLYFLNWWLLAHDSPPHADPEGEQAPVEEIEGPPRHRR